MECLPFHADSADGIGATMASQLIIRSRAHIREAWSNAALAHAAAERSRSYHHCGWHDEKGELTVRGALALAVIRAEIKRRQVPVDVSHVTEYGITSRLSRSVRVF